MIKLSRHCLTQEGVIMRRHLPMQFLAVVMICLGLASSARAQSAMLRIGDGYACSFNPGFHILPVYVVAAGPVETARFNVVASSAVTFLDPPNGEFNVTLNPCMQNGSLGQLLVIIPAGPAVTFTILPATGDSEIEMTDCDGYALHAVQECETAQLIAPYRPTPTDGATGVPINQLLSYVGSANYVVIATSLDFSDQQVICSSGDFECSLPLNPGLLAPFTTYYWQASYYCICGQVLGASSEVFSFTTGSGPLATEAMTWGHVKALYRSQ
jgi:hypothetical protein